MPRILGVDLGEKRTGIAVSDLTGTLAGGVCVENVTGLHDAAKKVAANAEKYEVCEIVVGKPLNMDGSSGGSVRRVELFAEILGGLTKAKIVLSDERLSTSLAHVYLNNTGTGGSKRKKVIDMLSAQIILQNYIDMMNKKTSECHTAL